MSFTNTIYAFSIFRPVSASMTTTTCYIPMWQLICIIAIPFLVIGATLGGYHYRCHRNCQLRNMGFII
ncbi:uncharacterized protein OCT59_014032 [Rhizophagus irregularis]|uniref:Uncharacterized protein n=1 Tax=Rhizophagus irregularis TaxID=588596 RepID=A0A915Z2P8_9GLOM|nr:hypothetical protein OCT59_014032 [Rhizophagus irregularis]GET58876.1 hypothetical protein RIR_jg19673.t1 [Rhizophagus irregularis DAOM 181602=DAOM 197198]CAB4467292.1 unnamed protein product [Rhizophagus irregularis]CAB5360250.1 unnamed protein product [Rhizophagus irregularis]